MRPFPSGADTERVLDSMWDYGDTNAPIHQVVSNACLRHVHVIGYHLSRGGNCNPAR
jgi:hypothetical protein